MFGFFDQRKIADTPTGWIFFVLVLLLVAWYIRWQVTSTDSYQLWNFHRHNADYQKLLAMLDHDRVLVFTNPEDPGRHGITAERIAEYRNYMSRIGCGSITHSTVSTLFVTDTWGSDAAFLFFPQAPPFSPQNYRRIEGDWYLAY